MTYFAGDDPDVVQPWFLRKTTWIIVGITIIVLAIGLGIFTYVGMKKVPEISGGVTIEADPDTKIYMGDKLVGTTQITFTWDELFGDEKHTPLAVELTDPSAKADPELVSGRGATALETQSWGGGSSGVNGFKTGTSGFRYLIRRADGQLDEVIGIVIDWAPADKPPRRYLLPVRLRKADGSPRVFPNQTGSSSFSGGAPGFVKAFGRSPIEIKRSWKFSSNPAPPQIAEEIEKKGLWEPGIEK